MRMILGEMNPTETVLVGLGTLVSLAVGLKSFFPKPRTPPIEAEFVTQTEFKDFKKDVKADMVQLQRQVASQYVCLADKLDGSKTEILNAGERRAIALHERINDLEAQVARLDERTK